MKKIIRKLQLFSILFLLSGILYGQPTLSLEECIQRAKEQNLSIRSDALKVNRDKALQKTAFNPDKTALTLGQDPTSGGSNENSISVTQNIAWPGVYFNQHKALKQQSVLSEKEKGLTTSAIMKEVKNKYHDAIYQRKRLAVYDYLDSLYKDFAHKAEIRNKTGETSALELLAAKNKLQELVILKEQVRVEYERSILDLKRLMNTKEDFDLTEPSSNFYTIDDLSDNYAVEMNPDLKMAEQNIRLAQAKVRLEQSKLWPDFVFGYSHQYVLKSFNPADIQRDYFPGTRIGGFQVGLALPIFMRSNVAFIKAEKAELAYYQNEYALQEQALNVQWQNELKNYNKLVQSLYYYTNSGLESADEQIRIAQFSFAKGEIGYVEYIQNISQAMEIKLNYLSTLNVFHQSNAELEYLMGK